MSHPSEYDRLGFKASDIYPLLERNGIKLGRPNGEPTPPVGRSDATDFPEWKRVMAAHPDLTVDDIAHAFANIDPYATGWRSDDENAEIARYRSLIRRSICTDEIEEWLEATPVEFDRDNLPIDWNVRPKALAAWCVLKRLRYPLPGAAAVPATNAEALAEIERLKAECDQLRKQNDTLKGVEDDLNNATIFASGLKKRLTTCKDELDQLRKKQERTNDVASQVDAMFATASRHASLVGWTKIAEEIGGSPEEVGEFILGPAGDGSDSPLRTILYALAENGNTIVPVDEYRKLHVAALQHVEKIRAHLLAELEAHGGAPVSAQSHNTMVALPHVTKGMSALFKVMRKHWSAYTKEAPPKSLVVARDIDEGLGYKAQKSGDPSRNGQALAALIRPDELREADGRINNR